LYAGSTPVTPQSKGQPSIQQMLQESTITKWPATNPKAQAITDSIGHFIACDLRPYSVVKTSSFKKMFAIEEPKYDIQERPIFPGV
jgi:hypothetical protein